MTISAYMHMLILETDIERNRRRDYRCVICGKRQTDDYVPECHDTTMKAVSA